MSIIIKQIDALSLLSKLKDKCVDFIYTDPPYNTGKRQENAQNSFGYVDKFENFKDFIYPILKELFRVMKDSSVICLTLDYREIHYVKVWMDEIFSRENFMGEIIWLSELGRTSTKNWSMKHQTTLIFKKGEYKFNFDKVPKITRKALKEGYDNDKVQHSVFVHTVSNTDPERVNYPNQKPEKLVEMLMQVHSNKGEIVLDPFCGSGTTIAVAKRIGRKAITCDVNPQAIEIATARLSKLK